MGWLEEQVERDIHYKVKMENWTKISKEEMQKGYKLVNLKKGELQILLAKALVREDKLREYCKKLNLASVSEDIEQILNEGSDE